MNESMNIIVESESFLQAIRVNLTHHYFRISVKTLGLAHNMVPKGSLHHASWIVEQSERVWLSHKQRGYKCPTVENLLTIYI